jgi:trypsin
MKHALDVNSRIVGGSIAESPIPWQVRLYGDFICGGTILDEYTILTATHCKITSNNYGYAGHRSFESGPKYQEFKVKKVINKNWDYSLVKLKQPLMFTNYVQPACLPTANFAHRDVAIASGWGKYQVRKLVFDFNTSTIFFIIILNFRFGS